MDPRNEWRELLAEDPEVDDVEMTLGAIAGADDLAVPAALGGVSDAVFDALLLSGGGEVGRSLLDRLDALLARATGIDTGDSPAAATGIVRCASLLLACGHEADPAGELSRRIGALLDGDLASNEVTSLALACAAHGLDDRVDELLGPSDRPFVPDEGFGPDAQQYVRNLVAGARAGATGDDLAASWTSFAAYFPSHRALEVLRPTDLLFGGYAFYVRFEGVDPGSVFDEINAFVRDIAGG